MTELKTLKDMREYTREGKKAKSPLRWINVYDLKAEAVKWVKEDIEEHYNLFRDILNGREIKSPTMTLIKKWMKRLDITEEDLK